VSHVRIVQVANFYGPRSGGIRTTMQQLGQGYVQRGHESVLVVPGPRDGDEQTPYGRLLTLAAPTLPRSGGYRVITDVDRVCTVLGQVGPDRLEVSDRASLRAVGWWARAQGVPAAMWAHERVDGVLRSFLPGRWPVRAMADSWNSATAARFDRVICSTAFAREEFDRIGWSRVEHVPLGVDLEQFAPARRDLDLRAELVGDADVLLMMCSRLSKEKSPERSLAVAEVLRVRGVSARLVVAGSGPLADKLEATARQRELPVTFLGHVGDRDQLASLLATADVVIAPGPIETFGLAALEALASGTPVVASRSSALREIVTDGAGRVAADSDLAFADAVEEILALPEETRRADARRRAERFPWTATIDAMLRMHDLAPRRAAGVGAAGVGV
jgi:alpha-1,6-mannosyltransferase